MHRVIRTIALVLAVNLVAALAPSIASTDAALPTKLRSGERVRWTPAAIEALIRVLRSAGAGHSEAAELAQIVHSESSALDVDPLYALALMKVESNFRVNALSPRGAVGLLQVHPDTARAVAAAAPERSRRRAAVERRAVSAGPVALRDPRTNVAVGLRYLQHLECQFADSTTALAAYNLGPSRVRRHLERGTPVPSDYAERVLTTYRALAARHDDGTVTLRRDDRALPQAHLSCNGGWPTIAGG